MFALRGALCYIQGVFEHALKRPILTLAALFALGSVLPCSATAAEPSLADSTLELLDDFVYSVNLLQYTETTAFNRTVYWLFFLILIVTGIAKTLLTKYEKKKGNQFTTAVSMLLSILLVLFLALAREAYAIAVAFLLLVIKGVLLLRYMKTS